MIEYEYSFKVKDIEPFIKFCKDNNYEESKVVLQTRTLYKNDSKILARITKNEIGEETFLYLNFKEENETENILKQSQESQILEINDSNKEFINSFLKMFKFRKSKELKRKRYVYKKDKEESVKFEIDEYSKPQMKVVAIEGDKKQVDKVYEQIKHLYNTYKI